MNSCYDIYSVIRYCFPIYQLCLFLNKFKCILIMSIIIPEKNLDINIVVTVDGLSSSMVINKTFVFGILPYLKNPTFCVPILLHLMV